MSPYKSIVFIADPEMPTSPGLTRAAKLAQLSGASLTICMFAYDSAIHAIGKFSLDAMQVIKQTYLLSREKWLYEMKSTLNGYLENVETELHWGTPIHQEIVARVAEMEPDLVVKDVCAQKGLRELLFTPLDWQLLRLCPSALLLVNPGAQAMPKRIIVAVDPAEALYETNHLHDHVVKEAMNLSKQCGAPLYMAHAHEGLAALGPDGILTSSIVSAMDEIRAKCRDDLLKYATHFNISRENIRFLEGTITDVLPRFANNSSADIVVIGTTQHSGLQRVIMGSTAERILGALHCDILAVKPDGFLHDLKKYLNPEIWEEIQKVRRAEGRPKLAAGH